MNELRKYLNAERGRGSDLARELGVTPGAIWQWADSQVPAERVLEVERVTGIPRRILRPDIYPPNEAHAA